DLHRAPRTGVGKRRYVGAHFAAAIYRIDHTALIAAQHAALVGDLDRGGAFAQAIEEARGRLAPQHILAADADRADIVGASVHRGDDARNFLRRILQVRVEGDHVAAARLLEGGEDRQVLP